MYAKERIELIARFYTTGGFYFTLDFKQQIGKVNTKGNELPRRTTVSYKPEMVKEIHKKIFIIFIY